MAPAPAVDKWGAYGFKRSPPAGVLTGIKKSSLQRGQRTRQYTFSQLRDELSRSDRATASKGGCGWGAIAVFAARASAVKPPPLPATSQPSSSAAGLAGN